MEDPPLRILVDARHLAPPWTGVGRYTAELLRTLLRRPEVTVGVLATEAIRVHLSEQGMDTEGPTARFAATQHPFVELESGLRIGRLVKAWGPDLVWGPAYDGSAIPRGIPGVVTVLDLACFHHRDTMKTRFAWLLRTKIRRAASAGALLLCNCEAVADGLRELFPRAKVAVARAGVGDAFTAVQDEAVERLRARHSLPDQFLLTVGGMHPRKQVGWLIEVLRELSEAPPLVVVGNPPPEVSDRVLSLGHLDDEDLPGLYRAARLVVHPARYEGFGLPPLEALATGTPVVATATGAVPEFLTGPDELVKVGDRAGMKAALKAQLSRPPDAELRASLRQRAIPWSWQASVEAHLRAFRSAG